MSARVLGLPIEVTSRLPQDLGHGAIAHAVIGEDPLAGPATSQSAVYMSRELYEAFAREQRPHPTDPRRIELTEDGIRLMRVLDRGKVRHRMSGKPTYVPFSKEHITP